MKLTLFKFEAKDIKQADVTRFKNLLIKLKVKIQQRDTPKVITGQKADLIICDEVKQ